MRFLHLNFGTLDIKQFDRPMPQLTAKQMTQDKLKVYINI